MKHSVKIWKFMCVIRDMVLDNNGMIFGGFVRDSIIHDYYASQFYEIAVGDKSTHLYNDSLYLPNTIDRTTVPKDIDVRMTERDFEILVEEFRLKKIEVHLEFQRDRTLLSAYFANIHSNDLTLQHIRLFLTIDMEEVNRALHNLPIKVNHRFTPPVIKLDVITSKNTFSYPLISTPDFECNALYLTKHGISLAPEISFTNDFLKQEMKKQKIMKDIIQKKTTYLNPDPDSEVSNAILIHRVSTMLSNGWLIEDDIVSTVNDNAYEGHCIICHEIVQNVHFKLHCCDARYHGKCLHNAMSYGLTAMRLTNTCIMCKDRVKTTETNLPYILSKSNFDATNQADANV